MNEKRVLYVDNQVDLDSGLCLLPARNGLEYGAATNYLRALRKIESGKYNAVILKDLEIPLIKSEDVSEVCKYKDKDHLVMQGLPIENALNFLRLSKEAGIPRIAVLSDSNSKDIVRIVTEEELAQIINPEANSLSIQIYNTLRNIFRNSQQE